MKIILIAFQIIYLTASVAMADPKGSDTPTGEDKGVSIRQDLIGKWEKQGGTNSTLSIEFKEDGSYDWVSRYFGGGITCRGIWETKDGYVRIKNKESNVGFVVKKWVTHKLILVSAVELKTQVEGEEVYIWKRIKSNKPSQSAELIDGKKLLAYADISLNIEWYIPNDWKPLNVDIGINTNQSAWVNKGINGTIYIAKENRILSQEQIQKEEKVLREVDREFEAYDLKRSGRKWRIQTTKFEQMYTLHMITHLDEKTVRFAIVSTDPSENDQLMKVITGTFMYVP